MNAPRLFAALLLFALPAIATDVSVSVSPEEVREDSGDDLIYTFTRTGAPTGVLTVNFRCMDGQNNDFILSGTDVTFTPATGLGSITFQVGESTKALTVDPIADNEFEGNENVRISVTAASGGNVYDVSGAPGFARILEDDGTVSVSPGGLMSVAEDGAGNLNFRLLRGGITAANANALTVYLTVSGTASLTGDYTHNFTTLDTGTGAATVIIPAGQFAFDLTINPAADATVEADETVVVTVNENITPPAATGGYSVVGPTSTGTIQNDDLPIVTLLAIDAQADENTADTGTWRISRDSTVGNLVVDLGIDAASTASANDFVQNGGIFLSTAPGATGTVTIPDGESHVDIVLTPLPDSTPEENETIRLIPIPAVHYTLAPLESSTITIWRNDFPFEVTHVNDAGEGSLRWVIENANALGGNPTITFEGPVFTTPQTITLASELPQITSGLTIQGPAAPLTLSGDGIYRVFFFIAVGESVTLADLTIADGYTSLFGQGGAGIFCAGDVTILRCTFRDNFAEGNYGGGLRFDGSGSLFVKDSTFTGNEANQGGGIYIAAGAPPYTAASPHARLVNTTLSGNTAGSGGGLLNAGGLTFLVNCTATGNAATLDPAGGVSGGGIGTLGFNTNQSTRLVNTLVVGNIGGDVSHVFGGNNTNASLGGNLIGTGNSIDAFPSETTTAAANTILGPLADNGGPTMTHALFPGSPALDKGVNANAVDPFDAIFGDGNDLVLTNDQRGQPRFTKGLATSAAATVDIGAYELFAAPTFTSAALQIQTGSAPLDLTSATGVSPTGGTFSGPGVSGGLFDPSLLGPGDYTLVYTATDPFGIANSAMLTVTVLDPTSRLTLTQPTRFPTTRIGDSTRPRRLFLRNEGGESVKMLQLSLDGPAKSDYLAIGPAMRSLSPGEATYLQVRFRPRGTGHRKAILTVQGDLSSVSVPLGGRGKFHPPVRPPRGVK